MSDHQRYRVGELRPSQLFYAYGVGAVVDLPHISAMVMGLDVWDTADGRPIDESRLLMAVRADLGYSVQALRSLPWRQQEERTGWQPLDSSALVGIPVAPFPRWLVCPTCRTLATIDSGLFQLKTQAFRPDLARYVHANCSKAVTPPTALPARFLVACKRGHLDEFPWVFFVHRGPTGCAAKLRLEEFGVSGEATDIQVKCETCQARRRLYDAFDDEAVDALPGCRGRWPHLGAADEEECPERSRAILLGASNSWFPLTLTALSLPVSVNRLDQLVEEHWSLLEDVGSVAEITTNRKFVQKTGELRALLPFSDQAIWDAVQFRRSATSSSEEMADLKAPEWRTFSQPRPELNGTNFRLREVATPAGFESLFERVVIAERIREVKALVGFTRIESPGDFGESVDIPEDQRGRLTFKPPAWVPAAETRGEGIFLQIRESTLHEWATRLREADCQTMFLRAHRRWRRSRKFDDLDANFPGLRFVLLHSFAHALIRQFALECGYAMASIREQIYALPPEDENGPMAGVLLYTAAPDSEGTLGGLARLGEPDELGRHMLEALEAMRLCASDPLCADHQSDADETLHGAACHACLFAPETCCERGNRYLDRAVLVPTIGQGDVAFFGGVTD